jgi:hypothetical protein
MTLVSRTELLSNVLDGEIYTIRSALAVATGA